MDQFVGDAGAVALEQIAIRGQRFGRGHIGHRDLVGEPLFGALEGGGHVEDRLAALHRDDAAGGEAATLEVAHDAVDDRQRLVAGAHEIGVERVRGPALADRAHRRDQRLRDHLAAEHAAASAGFAGSAIQVGVDRLDVEQRAQLRDQRLGRRRRFGVHGCPFVDCRLVIVRRGRGKQSRHGR